MSNKCYMGLNIPDDWVVKHIEDVADVDNKNLSSNTSLDYEFDYVSLSDVDSKAIRIETTRLTFINAPLRARRIVNQGDILMATVRPNLQGFFLIKHVVHDLVASTGFAVISAKKCNSKYLFQFLFSKSISKQLYQLLVGSNYPAINSLDVKRLKIALPPAPEQESIAECLDLWDEAINNITQLISQKENRKKWLMNSLLSGEKRVNGFNNEWQVSRLGEMFSERNDIRNHGLQLLSIGQNGVYPQSESEKRDTSNEDKSKYKRIFPGDIGYNTMRMWQGRSALSELDGIVSPAYTIITAKKHADPLFFSYLFKTPKLMYLFWRNSQGLVDDTLNCKFKDFSRIKVHLPEKNEQEAIAKILKAADSEINLLKSMVQKIRDQKKGLMQVLLTGNKRLIIN